MNKPFTKTQLRKAIKRTDPVVKLLARLLASKATKELLDDVVIAQKGDSRLMITTHGLVLHVMSQQRTDDLGVFDDGRSTVEPDSTLVLDFGISENQIRALARRLGTKI